MRTILPVLLLCTGCMSERGKVARPDTLTFEQRAESVVRKEATLSLTELRLRYLGMRLDSLVLLRRASDSVLTRAVYDSMKKDQVSIERLRMEIRALRQP